MNVKSGNGEMYYMFVLFNCTLELKYLLVPYCLDIKKNAEN